VTGNTVKATAGSAQHILFQTVSTGVAGTSYRATFDLSYTNYQYIICGDSGDASWHNVVVDLSAGTLGTATNCTAKIDPISAGRYQVSILYSRTNGGNLGSYVAFATASNDAAPPTLTADGTETFVLNTAALQPSSLSSTHVPTTATPQYAGMSPRGQLENRFTSSSDFSTAYWTKTNTTATATTITASAGDALHSVRASVTNRPTVTPGSVVTLSVDIAYNNYQYAAIGDSADVAWHATVIDLTTGTTAADTNATVTVQTIGTLRYRVNLTFTRTNGGTAAPYVTLAKSSTSYYDDVADKWNAAGTEKIDLYSMQYRSAAASSTYQPTTTAPVIGVGVATPAIWFDGVNDGLASATLAATMAQPQTIIAVAQRNRAFTTNNLLVGDSAGANCIIYGDNGSSNLTAFGGANLHVAAINYNPFVVSAVFNGASSSTFLNGAAGGAGNIGTTSATNRIWISGTADSERWSGIIESVILFNTALSAANRQWVERFLGARCGIKVA
jgi:hypothetical protein